jgi:hypothetical protein
MQAVMNVAADGISISAFDIVIDVKAHATVALLQQDGGKVEKLCLGSCARGGHSGLRIEPASAQG